MNVITNTSKTPLGLPGQPLLEPNATLEVSDEVLAKLRENRVVEAWITGGFLTVGDVAGRPEESEDEEKERLVAYLASRGIEKTVRTSLDKLRELVAEAEAAEREELVEVCSAYDIAVPPDATLQDIRNLIAAEEAKE